MFTYIYIYLFIYIREYIYIYICICIRSHTYTHRRKFRSQTSDNMDRWKSRGGKSQGGEETKWEDQRRERGARKGRRGAIHCVFFAMICGSGGSKSRLAKAAGAEPCGQMRHQNCTALWRQAHVQVKNVKAQHVRSTFGSWDVEKVHAVVARSTFPIQNVHFSFRALLEVEMSKKCTPLWREAHFQVKMYKARQVRTTFGSWDVEKVHAVVAPSTLQSQNVQSTPGSDHFLTFRCRKVHGVVAWSAFARQKFLKNRGSDHFLTFRCRKSARSCGAKQIWKTPVSKTEVFEPFLTFRCTLTHLTNLIT